MYTFQNTHTFHGGMAWVLDMVHSKVLLKPFLKGIYRRRCRSIITFLVFGGPRGPYGLILYLIFGWFKSSLPGLCRTSFSCKQMQCVMGHHNQSCEWNFACTWHCPLSNSQCTACCLHNFLPAFFSSKHCLTVSLCHCFAICR